MYEDAVRTVVRGTAVGRCGSLTALALLQVAQRRSDGVGGHP